MPLRQKRQATSRRAATNARPESQGLGERSAPIVTENTCSAAPLR
jgi:hypothetical protein